MKKTARKTLFLLITAIFSAWPFLSMADGMMMPPQDYWIQETGQKGVILFEDGIETLVVSTSFQGDAEDFAWVIPVPNQPEITKASDELFDSLQSATRTNIYFDRKYYGMMEQSADVATGTVTVVETKNVDYYEATVLTATDADDLATWFEENEYNYPESADYILESYIDNGWYFVAMKINPDSLEFTDVENELRAGHATPVMLKFAADYPVYPMKISSIVSNTSSSSDAASYSTGKFGKAIKVDTADVVSTYNDILSIDAAGNFNTSGGSLSMWVRPTYTYDYASNLQAVSVYNQDNAAIFSLSVEYSDIRGSYMLLRVHDKDGYTTDWITENIEYQNNVWQRFGVTWEEGQLPKIYFQGNEVAIVDVNNLINKDLTLANAVFEMEDLKGNEVIHIGESGNYAYVDEFKLFNIPQDDTIMLSEYLVTEPVTYGDGSGLVVAGHFDDSLLESVSGDEFTYKAGTTTLSNYYDSIPVLLYVLTDSRTELPNFSTSFANYIDQASTERLAVDDNGAPLLQPNNDKLFLTVMSNTMTYSEMTEDLFIRNATSNTTIGNEIKIDKPVSSKAINYVIVTSILLTILFGAGILVVNKQMSK